MRRDDVRIGMRVRPIGNHMPGIVETIGADVHVRCDCGHMGRYDVDELRALEETVVADRDEVGTRRERDG